MEQIKDLKEQLLEEFEFDKEDFKYENQHGRECRKIEVISSEIC